MELRAALGDPARRPRVVRTVARFGYAFCADAVAVETRLAEGSARHVPPPLYRLVWGRREIALKPGEILIGRDQDAVVWIDEGSVSRRHALVVVGESGATLEDLGSKNGTYWKGRKIRGTTALADKDELRIGPVSLVLRILRRTGSTLSSIEGRFSK
jgi:hypothetical protein